MGKLTPQEIDEYFDIHLPYRTGILLEHYRMRNRSNGRFVRWRGRKARLDACFVAALVTARLYLNVLGIGKNGKSTALVNYKDKTDDVTVDDLGGKRVDVTAIAPADQKILLDFIIMADKAAAHFTRPHPHDRTTIPNVIKMIHGFLKTHLYDVVGRTDLEVL